MNKFKLITSLGFALLALFFTPLIFAGGGGVDIRVNNGSEDLHWVIVYVYFDPKLFTCKGMSVSFNFESPESGDVISSTNDNLGTITDDANLETVNGKQYLRCSTYAKVYSAELKWNRILNISFNGANLAGERKIAVSFGVKYNPDDLPLLAWESSSDSVEVPTPTVQPAVPTPVQLRANLNPRLTTTPTPQPKVIDQPLITGNENNNEALDQKIANLEVQLAESKQRQNFLEQRINDLINFIKRLFPFFQ